MAKVMISVPDDVLERIDATARARGTSRSGFLRDAAEREIERRDPEWIDRELREIRAWSNGEEALDSTDWIRRDRDSRGARH